MTWTTSEITHKLDQIATLQPDHLRGWWNFLHGKHHISRSPFPGELAALHSRAQKLGIILEVPK